MNPSQRMPVAWCRNSTPLFIGSTALSSLAPSLLEAGASTLRCLCGRARRFKPELVTSTTRTARFSQESRECKSTVKIIPLSSIRTASSVRFSVATTDTLHRALGERPTIPDTGRVLPPHTGHDWEAIVMPDKEPMKKFETRENFVVLPCKHIICKHSSMPVVYSLQ